MFWLDEFLHGNNPGYESNCEMKERIIEEAEFYNKYGYYPNEASLFQKLWRIDKW